MKATRAQVRTATALEDIQEGQDILLGKMEEVLSKLDVLLARVETPKATPRTRTTKAAKD